MNAAITIIAITLGLMIGITILQETKIRRIERFLGAALSMLEEEAEDAEKKE